MLAGGDVGWGGKMPNKVIADLDLEMCTMPIAEAAASSGVAFRFPPSGGRSNKSPRGSGEDPAPITNRERSISAPNVSHTIINSESMMPSDLSYFRNHQKDIRSKIAGRVISNKKMNKSLFFSFDITWLSSLLLIVAIFGAKDVY
jgi:hypothetical protein